MMMIIFPLVILLLIIFSFFHRKIQKRCPLPPGPPGLPFIGNLLQLHTAAPHIYLWRLSRRYGPLMSLKLGSAPVIVVSSPELAREVMQTHDLAFCSRPKFLGQHRLSYNGSDISFAPYGEAWREMRKMCVVHLLSNKRVQSFRHIREEEVFGMMSNLSPGRVANISAMAIALTNTLICRVAFGKSFGGDEKFEELLMESQAVMAGFFVSDYIPWLGWVDTLSGMIARLDRVAKDLDEFFEELIHEHLDPNWPKSKNPNILDILIQLERENSSSIALTWDRVKAVLMDIFVAGTDTAAAVIIWAMVALIKNPTIMKILQKEIMEVVGNRRQVDENDIPKLPYLKAVIKEAMRLFPPAPLLLPRESIENCNLNGYTIPAKTLVFINAWAIARDPYKWENPNEFVPGRFFNSTIDVIGTDFEVIPFGAGRRGCPAIAMGLVTVELTLANLVHSFDWELPPGMTKYDVDTEVLPGVTMHKKHPLCLIPINKYILDQKNLDD